MFDKSNVLKYNSYSRYLTRKFGCKVKKISIDGGFTCPNKDGTKGFNGCTFCNEQSYTPYLSIKDDIIQSIKNQITNDSYKYIAYFQTNTNTYASESDLRDKYNLAIGSSPLIIGLNIGTRSDCFPDYVFDIIKEYAKKIYLSIDIGIESIYDETLKMTNRGHDYNSVIEVLNELDKLRKVNNLDFDICGHIMIGFPWETRDEQMAYVYEINKLPIDHLKINNLQVVANTKLAELYNREPFYLYSQKEYAEFIAEFLSYLSPKIVIQRLTAYCPENILLYPKWQEGKNDFYLQLNDIMEKNELCQGSKYKIL